MKKVFLILLSILFISFSNLFATTNEEKKLYDKAMELMDEYRGYSSTLYEALYEIEKIKNINPKSKYYFISYSKYLRLKGYISGTNYDEKALLDSKIVIEQALEIEEDFFDTYYYGFFTYLYSEDLITAKKFIEKVSQLSKTKEDEVKLLYMKSNLASEEKNYQFLLENSQKILEMNFSKKYNISAMSDLTTAYKNLEQYDKAEFYYKKIIEQSPNAWSIFNLGSFYYYYTNEYDKAIKYCKEAISIMDFPLANKVLGKAYYKKGSKAYWEEKWYQDALEYFKLAVEYYPTSNAYYGLGLSFYQVGHAKKDKEMIEDAKKAFEYSLQINPDNQYSKEQLSKVNKLLTWIEENE